MMLAFNVGSSTVKFALFDRGGAALCRGLVDRFHTAPILRLRHPEVHEQPLAQPGLEPALHAVVDALKSRHPMDECEAVVHRVVHGGHAYTRATRITTAVLADLWALAPLAPLHQPVSLQAVEIMQRRMLLTPQYACFDTGFHAGMDERERRLPIPRTWADKGMERYGFHGISYHYLAAQLAAAHPALAKGRVVMAHLGSGASLCAMQGGRSIATTMGMTALDGLMMATRPGSIDPGAVLHLILQQNMPPETVETMLYHESGLKGVSGISGDMRELLASESDTAHEAVELFIHQLLRHLGSLTMLLGGLDAVIFSGGIGEHCAPVRARVMQGLKWLGLEADAAANNAHAPRITTAASPIAALIIPTDEETQMAVETMALMKLENDEAA